MSNNLINNSLQDLANMSDIGDSSNDEQKVMLKNIDLQVSNELSIIIVEYVWIDCENKTRSKTRVINGTLIPGKEEEGYKFHIDLWNYDGSSTGQSIVKNSDIILYPRSIFNDPFNTNTSAYKYYLCMCEIFNVDGTPHTNNNRAQLFKTIQNIGEEKINNLKPLFGIEQEYVILNSNNNLGYGWHNDNFALNGKQGKYYCGVGEDCAFGRKIAMEHMNACIKAGISICGINAEVAPSQWEFQIGVLDSFTMGDQLWMARYILERVAELNNVRISYDPKPFLQFNSKWNGSGAHVNFSTQEMRDDDGINAINKAIIKMSKMHKEHMAVYGEGNEKRMTGENETSKYDVFTHGDCDRSSSIRIPINVKLNKKGYLEDRRPASNADPYLVCSRIIETVCDDNL